MFKVSLFSARPSSRMSIHHYLKLRMLERTDVTIQPGCTGFVRDRHCL